MTKTILSLIILVGIVMNHIYIKQLEERIDALKSQIEMVWQINLGEMADASEKWTRWSKDERSRR